MLKLATVTKRATRNFSEAAGESVYVIVTEDNFTVFCTELGMYRIMDKYPTISHGYSDTEQCWYAVKLHNLEIDGV